jgi:hypothetical protein
MPAAWDNLVRAASTGALLSAISSVLFTALMLVYKFLFPIVSLPRIGALELDMPPLVIGAALLTTSTAVGGAYSAIFSGHRTNGALRSLDTGIASGIGYFTGIWGIATIATVLATERAMLSAHLIDYRLWIDVITANYNNMGWAYLVVLVASIVSSATGAFIFRNSVSRAGTPAMKC